LAPASVTDTERVETPLPQVTKPDAALPETSVSGERPTVPAEAADPFEEELPFSD
jgi:hypothetical protein